MFIKSLVLASMATLIAAQPSAYANATLVTETHHKIVTITSCEEIVTDCPARTTVLPIVTVYTISGDHTKSHVSTVTVSPPTEKTTTVAPPTEKTTTVAPPTEKTTTVAPPTEKTTTVAPPVVYTTTIAKGSSSAVIKPNNSSSVIEFVGGAGKLTGAGSFVLAAAALLI